MSINILFYVLFLSQIILISYYYPKQIIKRIEGVLKKFPPESYPKLYPESADKVIAAKIRYQLLNQIILVIGLLLMGLYALMSKDYDNGQKFAEGLPLMFGMVQFIPFMLLEVSGCRQFKLMRKANKSTSRSADLTPRHLFNYVSPLLVISAVLLLFTFIFFDLYIHDFTITNDLIIKIITLSLVHALFIGLAVWHLTGKRLDPHQAIKDRSSQTQFSLQSMGSVSIFLSLFLMANSAVDVFELGYMEIIINSIYFQVIAFVGIGGMLRTDQIDTINFDVYKADNSII
ncbi:hypothetical protein [Colwellia hornerae]|uniref:Uncharacterized protein n=1 Tax=Colwellia hornerae TaxID=89402 RepID=A0A5C6QPH9_9GAMM|nr:hypothetical protein [Colwellia hornerae]TWX56297.1 hypothetical protein ESZ28_05265 [Colwellia hornerae]TWX62148.1 hypothetical protein ESZ26_04040 [Colwellia hornerae]TWX70550.1 hypothetical protein ESZ27_03295 [Colwellia hornerae]